MINQTSDKSHTETISDSQAAWHGSLWQETDQETHKGIHFMVQGQVLSFSVLEQSQSETDSLSKYVFLLIVMADDPNKITITLFGGTGLEL